MLLRKAFVNGMIFIMNDNQRIVFGDFDGIYLKTTTKVGNIKYSWASPDEIANETYLRRVCEVIEKQLDDVREKRRVLNNGNSEPKETVNHDNSPTDSDPAASETHWMNHYIQGI